MESKSKIYYALAVLFAINTMNFFDRQILGAIAEPIRKEWGLSDGSMGALGTAFTLLYAAVGVPLGRLTDKTTRTSILSAGVFVWSLFTAASGLARNFFQLFALRLGVGVGEAACAPAATSLIGDLFPASKRAKALSIFMMGLPIGIALSYYVSGAIAASYGWRSAFYVAGIPGLICALAALAIREPKRGGTEVHDIGNLKRAGSPYKLVLSIPTMWWLIASGALHNFNMYAIGSFLSPFLMRYHGATIQEAGNAAMFVNGLSGIPGLIIGGLLGDAVMKRRKNGRLLVGAIAILISVPLNYFALNQAKGDILAFGILMGLGVAVMYAYYSTVYSTIQDVIEPSLRGTAMALYFFAMYVLGASLGPVGTGLASDYFTQQAAIAAGAADLSRAALEPFRAEGLHSAMYAIPILGALLTLVLFAGSRTVTKDMEKLQRWMRESSSPSTEPGSVKAEAAK
ncbi:MAG TPA: MFS transporter [Blastocatellia bacterium]|jgi:MFS family permease|nr:MFS transporter [Blastocatellia bacterium]